MPSINSFTTSPVRSTRTAVKSARPRKPMNWSAVTSALSTLCLVLSVIGVGSYIYFTNASVSKGYELKKEQAKVDELNEIQKRLVVQQAALGSIVKVNDVASTAGMVPVTNQEFLSANQLSSR